MTIFEKGMISGLFNYWFSDSIQLSISFGEHWLYTIFSTMFSDEKHLSTIITSISGKSSKKALIEPKTLFNGQLVPFSDQFFPAKILSINRFN